MVRKRQKIDCWKNVPSSLRNDESHFTDKMHSTSTVKHVYFASIKFLQFEYNHKIKYRRIFGTAHQHDLVCIEYQLFHGII